MYSSAKPSSVLLLLAIALLSWSPTFCLLSRASLLVLTLPRLPPLRHSLSQARSVRTSEEVSGFTLFLLPHHQPLTSGSPCPIVFLAQLYKYFCCEKCFNFLYWCNDSNRDQISNNSSWKPVAEDLLTRNKMIFIIFSILSLSECSSSNISVQVTDQE